VTISPELLSVRARNPEQMRLANALCRLAELARPSSPPGLDAAMADRTRGGPIGRPADRAVPALSTASPAPQPGSGDLTLGL
jgi:hypothetical protein